MSKRYTQLSIDEATISSSSSVCACPSRLAVRVKCVALQTFAALSLALAIFGFRCLMFVENSPCVVGPRLAPLSLNASSVAPTLPSRRRRLPDAIIIGVRKCGTRALLTFLGAHPSIKPAGREIHFFDEHFENGPEWYLRQMPNAADDQVVVEKTPAYFVDPEAPGRVHGLLGDSVKLVLIVKDPVERAVSDYLQLKIKFQKHSSNLDYDPTMAPFERKVMSPDGSRVNVGYKPIRIGLYARHLQRWLKYFPLERILVVDGEEFVQHPFPSLRRVEEFLGVEHKLTSDRFFFNREKGFYCLRRETGKAFGVNQEGCLNKSKGRPHPKISERVRNKLTRYYAPRVREFFRLIGKSFDEWPTAKWKQTDNNDDMSPETAR